jgi:inosine/xanthosine triphosphate pyrophosphatase family protein
MALRLYAATTSQGKLRDFRTAAAGHPIHSIESIRFPEIATTLSYGPSLYAATTRRRRRHLPEIRQRDTRRLKAVYYSRFAPGELVVADDSGLEVDALGGAPGVRSARFAADSGLVDSPDANDNTDVWNNMLLLQKMAGVSGRLRTARYHCVLGRRARRRGGPHRRWRSRRDDSGSAARHRRLRLRSALLPAGTGQDHGRDRSRNQALAQPSRARDCGAAADAAALSFPPSRPKR